jgi:hypothetical protein
MTQSGAHTGRQQLIDRANGAMGGAAGLELSGLDGLGFSPTGAELQL